MADVMKPKEAWAYLRITRNTLYALLRSGKLGRKVGGQWRVTKQELDEYLRGGKA